MMRDEGESYENLRCKCGDMHDAINHYPIIIEPRNVFDPFVDSIDFSAKNLLENYTDVLNRDAVPVAVIGDGDCLFHTFHKFYPELSVDEIRARCVDELCLNEQYYSKVVNKMGFELVDDESLEEHVLRILHKHEYAGVLTLAALSSVIMRPIRSIYPHVNDNDPYFEILNTTFFPRTVKVAAEDDESLRVMWTGPEQKKCSRLATESLYTIFNSRIDFHQNQSSEKYQKDIGVVDSKINDNAQEVEDENINKDVLPQVTFDSRQLFPSGSVVIKEILNAVKNNLIDDNPPKQVTYSSKFVVKFTEENRLSVGKDGNGTWIQTSSSETAFVLTIESYQIVRRNAKGRFHYNERVGREYVQCAVEDKDVLILKRVYATNKANSSFRRMICFLASKATTEEVINQPLPMFVQYMTTTGQPLQKPAIQPHGNATKYTRPFTATVPSVIEHVRAQSITTTPSAIYKDALQDVAQIKTPTLNSVRDRTQIYNARRKNQPIIDEYLAVMKRMENQNGVVAKFPMRRAKAPILVLARDHLIKEIKRCCLNTTTQPSRSVLCIDTRCNLGQFFVTPTTFRNTALQNRRTKKTPVYCGPTIIYYRSDSHAYEELLDYMRQQLGPSSDLVIGSDGAPAIKSAVSALFPHSVYLFCVRHVRDNIEHHLIKIQLSKDERRQILEYLFDCPESLIQSESADEFNCRFDGLRDVWHDIVNRNAQCYNDSNTFLTWFTRYQLEIFRYHLIASVRIQAKCLDHHDSPRLFYNNDIEALNHVLKHDANWEVQPLSHIIDIIENHINMQKNESIRALYDADEYEIVAPYTRFVHDAHIWTHKSTEQRSAIIAAYYSYQPQTSQVTTDFNIPPHAGRKSGKTRIRGAITTRKSNKKGIPRSSKTRQK